MTYSGGPVADTGTDGLTITPVYWVPADTQAFPDGYEDLINRYIKDIAADSGQNSDVYSVVTQYYAEDNTGTKTNLQYKFRAGDAIVDTQPFPSNGCTPDQGYTACLTDAQLQTELQRVASADNLPADLAHFYPLFTAPAVETQDQDGSTSISAFCGYHRHVGNAPDALYYGNEVFEAQGCGEGQSPNNNVPADSAISTLSHEINEFLTDPVSDSPAWGASSAEIGDICANDYGHPLGSTDPANAQTTEYNQLINGDKYYTQTEFSNESYASLGKGFGCQQSNAAASKPTNTPNSTEQLFVDSTPNAINADGSTTSQLELYVSAQDGTPTPKDKVQFSAYVVAGSGRCGAMKDNTATTDDNGYISDNYTASKSDVVCAIVAKDALGGKSATVDVYQGSTQAQAPTADQTYPQTMVSGRQVTFTNTFKNNGKAPIANPTFDMSIFKGDKTKTNVDSSQVQLSYSTGGAAGPFKPIALTGSTIADGGISTNWTPPLLPAIAPGSTLVITYQLQLAPKAAAGIADNDLIALEGFLEQENLAAGTTTTVADTYASEVNVSDNASSGNASDDRSSASSSGSSAGIWIVIAVVVVVIIGGILVLRRRRRSNPTTASEATAPAGPTTPAGSNPPEGPSAPPDPSTPTEP